MTGVEAALIGGTILSTAVTAFGQIQQGQQAGAIAEYNEELALLEADRLAAVSEFEQNEVRRRTRREIGAIRARAGASGVVVNEGSPLLAQEQQAAEGKIDEMSIRFSRSVQEANARAGAALQKFQGRTLKRSQGFKAAGTLLTGASRVGERLFGPKPAIA